MHQAKLETQKQWNTTPCGTGDYLKNLEYGSCAFFDEVRRSRYEITDTWMPKTIDFTRAKGKKLLEIGHGMGTDLLTFAENGAEAYGIDLCQEHHNLASKNFAVHQMNCTLKLCDAANIDFPSNHFDIVYSNGVLHHTPDTIRCISEAYRVLKSDGVLIFSMYYTYSAFHLYSLLFFNGILKGHLFKLGYRGLLSTVERGADGINIKPLVKTYSKKQLKHILQDFSKVEFKIAHFSVKHLPILGKILPKSFDRFLEKYLGWYVIAFATK